MDRLHDHSAAQPDEKVSQKRPFFDIIISVNGVYLPVSRKHKRWSSSVIDEPFLLSIRFTMMPQTEEHTMKCTSGNILQETSYAQ